MKFTINLEIILATIFVLGIIVELFYIVPIILQEGSSVETATRSIFEAGVIISILVILVIVLLRQKQILLNLKYLRKKVAPRTSAEVRKELAVLNRDKEALKIVLRDGFIDEDDFNKKSSMIEGMIKKKEEELKDFERTEAREGKK